MSDRRLFAANTHVAHSALRGQIAGVRFTKGTTQQCKAAFTDLCRSPGQGRDKQILFGQKFQVLEVRDGTAFGFDPTDNYVGYVRANDLTTQRQATHVVQSRTSHIYAEPDFKSQDLAALSFGAQLNAVAQRNGFLELLSGGFVSTAHCRELGDFAPDPAGVAQGLLGTPYLWGGNTGFGIDCSGLVQAALGACGLPCPRDSDMQQDAWPDISPEAGLTRGDLVFWKGHVGMLLDAATLIHANAHHMMVAIEPLDQAIARIGAREFGKVTKFARPRA